MYSFFIILAVIIIAALCAYAAQLLFKLQQQKKQAQRRQAAQTQAAADRRAQLVDNIRYIAQAMLEERCELSEGVMRIGKLFELNGLSEQLNPEYPALFAHYSKICDHPIKEQRKALSKQQRMKLDYQRLRSEAELETEILTEAKRLTQYPA